MNLRQSFQEEHCFSKVALGNFGFEFCLNSKLLRQLYSIKPTGTRSCLFDAMLVGLEHMRGLYQMIEQSGRAGSWKLVHIIICDGRDGGSRNGWSQVKQAYRQAKARIRAYEFKTVVIAYNVTPQEYSQLLFLSELDAAIPIFPASYYHSEYEELNLGKLMKRLRRDIGLLFKQPRQSDLFMKKEEDDAEDVSNPYAISEIKFSYAVLFTISGNQQYDGEIWNSICNNINNFTRYLGDRDILGGIIYTEGVSYFKEDRFILKEEKKKLNIPPPPPPPVQPPPQNYAYGSNGQHIAYVPPPFIDPHPQPPPPPPRYNPPPPPQRNSIPIPPRQNQRATPINRSENSKKSEQSSSLVGGSRIDESKAYTMCEAGGKCRSCCACFLTILVLLIIGGAVFLAIR